MQYNCFVVQTRGQPQFVDFPDRFSRSLFNAQIAPGYINEETKLVGLYESHEAAFDAIANLLRPKFIEWNAAERARPTTMTDLLNSNDNVPRAVLAINEQGANVWEIDSYVCYMTAAAQNEVPSDMRLLTTAEIMALPTAAIVHTPDLRTPPILRGTIRDLFTMLGRADKMSEW